MCFTTAKNKKMFLDQENFDQKKIKTNKLIKKLN